MTSLHLHGKEIQSYFDLLGTNENNMTFSLGYIISQVPRFQNRIVNYALKKIHKPLVHTQVEGNSIHLQEHERNRGFTDIEIRLPSIQIIVEAKKGFDLPSWGQLLKYTHRFESNKNLNLLMVLTEYPLNHDDTKLFRKVNGVPVVYLNWEGILPMIVEVKPHVNHHKKRLLDELKTYLKRTLIMRNEENNWVYVVPLGNSRPGWSKYTWREFVEKKKVYFHPIGVNGYPKEPPTYLAFRYDGILQSIHHVEKCFATTNVSPFIPGLKRKDHEAHFVYALSNPIRPNHAVKSGKLWNTKLWAKIDTLLSCDTISQARKQSDSR